MQNWYPMQKQVPLKDKHFPKTAKTHEQDYLALVQPHTGKWKTVITFAASCKWHTSAWILSHIIFEMF